MTTFNRGNQQCYNQFFRPDSRALAAGKNSTMPKVLDNIITAAAPDPATYTVALTWANGETTVSSFRHLVGYGVVAAFTDPAFFAEPPGGEGRSLEWPGELDFCADPL
jgi:hypothetical protein